MRDRLLKIQTKTKNQTEWMCFFSSLLYLSLTLANFMRMWLNKKVVFSWLGSLGIKLRDSLFDFSHVFTLKCWNGCDVSSCISVPILVQPNVANNHRIVCCSWITSHFFVSKRCLQVAFYFSKSNSLFTIQCAYLCLLCKVYTHTHINDFSIGKRPIIYINTIDSTELFFCKQHKA